MPAYRDGQAHRTSTHSMVRPRRWTRNGRGGCLASIRRESF